MCYERWARRSARAEDRWLRDLVVGDPEPQEPQPVSEPRLGDEETGPDAEPLTVGGER